MMMVAKEFALERKYIAKIARRRVSARYKRSAKRAYRRQCKQLLVVGNEPQRRYAATGLDML